MAADIGVLDGALPLIRGDNPWEQIVVFWADAEKSAGLDLTGKTVVAEMRWRGGGSQAVTTNVTDPEAGVVVLSLTGAETAGLPFGRLAHLFVQVRDGATEITKFRAAIDVKEGLAA
jgi:hypothetical protein